MSNRVILLKRPSISPNIAPRGSECENNLVGSHGQGNFFQVLNLTLTPASRLNEVVTLKRLISHLIIVAMASDAMASNVLPEKNFGL